MAERTASMQVEEKLYPWLCLDCKQEFAIINVMRGDEFDQYAHWGNSDFLPFCPHCGSKRTSREQT